MRGRRATEYTVAILHEHELGEDGNADVVVELPSGLSYSGTFFTVSSLQSLLDEYQKTGECAGGSYMWAADMIVVRTLDRHTIELVVADLMRTGEFSQAFKKLKTP